MGVRFRTPEFVVVKRYYVWQTRQEAFSSPALIPSDKSPCGCDVFWLERQCQYVLCFPVVRRSWRRLNLHFEQAGDVEGDKPVVVLSTNFHPFYTALPYKKTLENFGDAVLFEGYYDEFLIEFLWSARPPNSVYRLHVRDSIGDRVTSHRLAFKLL
jgi:hypothetical protein